MKYTREQLADYVLGQLEPHEMQEIEQHLQSSESARREVAELQEALFQMAEELPAIPVNPDSWDSIQARLEPRASVEAGTEQPIPPAAPQPSAPRRSLLPMFVGWAAALVLVLAGGWYGLGIYQENQQTRLIESWLEQNQVVKPLRLENQTQIASVAFHQDGQALVIMNQKADAQKSYQVWGIQGGKPVSLGVISSRTFEVNTTGYEAIAVSLEPRGGSPTPTQVLGAVPVG
ncbi:anti-sigma factor domain-containing protein [Deinococcus cellulosilyticus]|uniref:Regulator of SigK n=1 Tax=Deinococcus cellulosilyticus (strain DSM 18568 / NBRC 106333 / KACC 11606 / 5516J-15) TaxID=1223518 RepID=A0A511MZ49_DEIC1|nr:anti-sigma factor [Deinococcus cellulosilyticus]GEM45809.1 anti-sigma E factor [Deinococcus cellulosilyticus NBRC 106333 = KACC 11606]